ncbi:MAG: hypothetical protein ACRERD_14825, partial [Candidatus Binatia bacterium]
MDMPTETVQDAGEKPVRHRQPAFGLVVAAFLSSFTSLGTRCHEFFKRQQANPLAGLAFSYSVFQ